MKPTNPKDLQAFVRLAATADGARLLAWLRESRDEGVALLLRGPDAELVRACGYTAALADILEVVDTAPNVVRETQHVREDSHVAALGCEYP